MNVTVANAIVPSRGIARPRVAEGLITAVTCASRRTRASIGSIADLDAGCATVPARDWKTISSESPAAAGNQLWSMFDALCDPVPGSVRLFDVLLPITLERRDTTASKATQQASTARRWAMVTRAILSVIGILPSPVASASACESGVAIG
jgi:hypothetical protein